MTISQTVYQLALKEAELLRAKKELDQIPEAAQIVECRAKRKELKAKQDQVIELTDEVSEKLARFEEEENRLLAKMRELQDTLDHSTDYRVTSKVTRDMDGLLKREQTINDETDALLADMLAKLDHKEHHLTEDFKEKGGEAKARVDALQAQIERLVGDLPAALQTRYAKVKAEKGGRGAAFLEGSHCSACHVELQTGALAKLKAGEAVTECPSCRRIFAARVEED